jgi:hypothetical protein
MEEPPKERIRFVDVGAGAYKGRAYDVAERRHKAGLPGKIVAVDLEAPNYTHDLPNLEHVQSDVAEYFKSQKPGSIDLINFDLSMAHPEGERELLAMYPDVPQEERHVVIDKKLADAMKHAMHDKSHIIVNTSKTVVEPLKRELQKHGFTTKTTPLAKALPIVQSQAFSRRYIESQMGRPGYVHHSVQIVARKPRRK